MKKWTGKVLIVILSALIGGGAYLFNAYGSLLRATPKTEAVVAEMKESNAKFTQTIEQYVGKSYAQSVEDQISAGEASSETVAAAETPANSQVQAEKPIAKTGQESGATTAAAAEAKAVPETEKDLIRRSLIELLQVKNEFSLQLQDLIDQARAEYSSLSPEDHSPDSKVRLGLKYMDKVIVLESQADAAIYGIIGELETALKESGYGTDIVETIKRYYEEQKELQRTYYMSKLKS